MLEAGHLAGASCKPSLNVDINQRRYPPVPGLPVPLYSKPRSTAQDKRLVPKSTDDLSSLTVVYDHSGWKTT